MDKQEFNRGLADFIDASPTPFHATQNLLKIFVEAGFKVLQESDPWSTRKGGSYVLTRNQSSLIAFQIGKTSIEEDGLRMVGAHTDSPCLRLKPHPVSEEKGYIRFGVEVYGGVLLNPWFDRDLSLAGRVTLKRSNGTLSSRLINFISPIAFIPSLAIHLDREANSKRSVNAQTMLPPIVGLASNKPLDIVQLLEKELKREKQFRRGDKILDFELSLYDVQPVSLLGLNDCFISGARLDNLVSCYTGAISMTASRAGRAKLLVCNDHEEVGSGSLAGARGNFLRSVLTRLNEREEAQARVLSRSMLVSTDNAHGVHPNFPEKHDQMHGPVLNKGPVVKVNNNQAYATNSESAALLQAMATSARVNLQSFVSRSDMGCGSTIGPFTATELGVRTVDVGVPTFGMHSIREIAGSDDAWELQKLLKVFYQTERLQVFSE